MGRMRPRAPLTPSALTGSVLTPSAQIRWWVAHAAVATTALLAVALAGGCGTSGVGAPPATGSGGDASGPPSGSGPVQSTPIGEPCDTETRCAAEPNADSACVVQECTLICHAGFADCDRVPTNGCEQSLLTTTSCGGCFIPCDPPHAFGSCLAGLCGVAACDLGWGDCDADPGNGCETPLVTATNCAACGTPCAVEHGSGGCNGGVCAVAGCEAGRADCDGSAATGCERALGTDADCGACGDDCSARAEPSSCQAGVCAAEGCEHGWGACDADPGNG